MAPHSKRQKHPTKKQQVRFHLYRNVRAGDLLEIFFISAVTSLLGLRFYLYLTGYPQVGGGSLHIAHMLWGGVLMLAALVLALSFLGRKVQNATALVGGIGFGIFIDELGKFITKDNNYFFKPTIGILYALFVVLYLTFNFLGRRQKLTSREYQLNALAQMEDAVVQDLDPHEKQRVLDLLNKADPKSPLTAYLKEFLQTVSLVPAATPGPLERFKQTVDRWYARFWHARRSNGLVQAFFALEVLLFLLAVVYIAYVNFDNVADIFFGKSSYSGVLVLGEFISAVVAAAFVAAGLYKLPTSRSEAFEWFRRATLVNIFLTEFFVFSREQFGALPGFIFNLLILGLINFVSHQERRGSHLT